jgi:Tfp pilus assembly protein PilO
MNLSRRDQALLAFLVIILIGFIFYRLVYVPINQEIQTITESNQELQLDKQRLEVEVKKGPAKTEETKDKFAHLDKRLPTEDEIIPLLTMLDETTGKHKLPFASLDYKGAEKPGETGAQLLVFNIGTKGKMMQLLDFLHDLESAERLISVEEVSFSGVKVEAKETEKEDEPGPPAYYIAPPEIPQAKLKRIRFEIVEEKETKTDIERPVADSFMPDNFEMKLTIKTYCAGHDKAGQTKDAKTEKKPKNNANGEV